MRRPAVRFLLTLVCAASVLGVVPATSEAGIIPWAWDTMFGPVGSIQARRANYVSGDGGDVYATGCCRSPRRMFAGFRGWRGYSAGCCNSGCDTCGVSDGCSSCGTGSSIYDGGYGAAPYGGGGCASGQCNVNYPPGQNCATDGGAPVTPAPAGGPAPYNPGSPAGTNDKYLPPITPDSPAPGNATQTEDFKPAGTKVPAPTGGDPTKDENYIPPKVTPAPTPGAVNGTPPVEPGTTTPAKKSKLTEDDDKGTNIGPRLELDGKVTWRHAVPPTRLTQTAARVTASANRQGLFAKTAWHSGSETELAKK